MTTQTKSKPKALSPKAIMRKASYKASDLHDEYMNLWSTMEYKPGVQRMCEKTASRLISDLDRYKKLEKISNVPAAFIMVTHERESGGNWNTYLGNGEPLNRVTRLVPKGRGPFATFEEGALDAFKLEGLGNGGVQMSDWDEGMLGWWEESFNGFGYRMRGLRSPYLWGGTNHQQLGKYTSDGKFDPSVMDPQLGAIAIYAEIIRQQPDLNLGGAFGDPALLKAIIPSSGESITVASGGIKMLQTALNALGAEPKLVEDGWIGGKTKKALKDFEASIGGLD